MSEYNQERHTFAIAMVDEIGDVLTVLGTARVWKQVGNKQTYRQVQDALEQEYKRVEQIKKEYDSILVKDET